MLEALIKEWYISRYFLYIRGYIPWVRKVERKRARGVGITVEKKYLVMGILRCEWIMGRYTLLWIPSPISRVNCC
jgi:hypothetical protein